MGRSTFWLLPRVRARRKDAASFACRDLPKNGLDEPRVTRMLGTRARGIQYLPAQVVYPAGVYIHVCIYVLRENIKCYGSIKDHIVSTPGWL